MSVNESGDFYRPGGGGDYYNNSPTGLGTPPTWLAPAETGSFGGARAFSAGMGADFWGITPPYGFFLCDGSALDRTTYSALFKVISTLYGAGNGSSTFNLPDCRGRTLVMKGGSANAATLGQSDGLGSSVRSTYHGHSHNLTLPQHTHQIPVTTDGSAGVSSGGGTPTASDHGQQNASNTGGINTAPGINGTITPGVSNVDTPCFIVCNKVIKS